jgi:hypothetical protein
MCNKSLCLNLIGPQLGGGGDRALGLLSFSSARGMKWYMNGHIIFAGRTRKEKEDDNGLRNAGEGVGWLSWVL